MAEVLKVSIMGTGLSGEVWSVNPVYQLATEPALTFEQLNTICTAINALPLTGLTSFMPPVAAVTGVRIEQREMTGQLVSQLEQQRAAPAPGTGTASHPIQTAIVLSLITNFPGGQGRGRLYWPAYGVAIESTTLRFSSGVVTGFLSAMETYLSGIEAAIEATAGATGLMVWSRTGSALHQVVRLRAGNVPDVQRRRRDAFVETYSSLDYTP